MTDLCQCAWHQLEYCSLCHEAFNANQAEANGSEEDDEQYVVNLLLEEESDEDAIDALIARFPIHRIPLSIPAFVTA